MLENVMMNQNGVNVEATKEEKEMDVMENAQAHEEVKQENDHSGMIRRFCTQCGKEMWIAPNQRTSVCNECKAERKAVAARVAHQKAQERKERLGLITKNLSLYETTFNLLKENSKKQGVSIAELLRVMVEGEVKTEPAKQENIA